MNNIKSYLYLDEYKLYSISSQLFKGLTEYILQTSSTNNTEETDQKGPVGSGRILADIFREETTNEEKKTLYDYAFNLLEEELINYDKVIEINESNVDKKISALENATFIKVSGLAIFNDMKMLSDLIENFNELGESLGYFANRDEFENFFNSYEGESSNPKKDRNKQAKSNFMSKKMREQMEKLLEEKEWRFRNYHKIENVLTPPAKIFDTQILFSPEIAIGKAEEALISLDYEQVEKNGRLDVLTRDLIEATEPDEFLDQYVLELKDFVIENYEGKKALMKRVTNRPYKNVNASSTTL